MAPLDDLKVMFPLTELLSHAELTKRTIYTEPIEARRALRQKRYGNLTLFPVVEHTEPIADDDGYAAEEPRISASISNVSASGVGLILAEELPSGLEFVCQWPEGEYPIPLRFEVVHSRPISAGMYRTGARLIAGVLPEQQTPSDFVQREAPQSPDYELKLTVPVESQQQVAGQSGVEPSPVEQLTSKQPVAEQSSIDEPAPVVFSGGILKFEPYPIHRQTNPIPAPAGTFRASHAFGFDKTESLDGVTSCGWERSIQIRRDGDRLWIYIHSPGKKNGWGLFVDPDAFESALQRVQESAESPFISSLAA